MPQGRQGDRGRILRPAMLLATLTVLSRILGLAREQVRAYYLGTGMASDAFGIAATIPNMFRRMLAEGAMTAAFVPVFTHVKTHGDRRRLGEFFSNFMSLFVILLVLVAVAGIAFSDPLIRHVFAGRFSEVPGKVDLTVSLTRTMFPYLLLVSVAAILQATLNTFSVFGPPALGPILLNLSTIVLVVACTRYLPNAAWALAFGFLLGGVLQVMVQVPFLRGRGLHLRPTLKGLRDPAVRQLLRIFVPGVFSAGIYQVNTVVAQVVAASLPEGSVASLQFSLRLQELVLGVFAVSVATVILPTMSKFASEGELGPLLDTLGFSLRVLGFITVPASLGLVLLARPIVTLLFQYGSFDTSSTDMTVFALYFHAAGIFFIAAYRVVVQVFYAQKDLLTPAIVAFFVMLLHAALCVALAVPLRHGGVALAGSIGAFINGAALLWLLRRRLGALGLEAVAASLLRTLLASLVMALAVSFFLPVCGEAMATGNRWRLAAYIGAAVPTGIGAFMLASWLLRSPELADFVDLVRRRSLPGR